MQFQQTYQQIYHKPPEYTSFCPYRISPLGAHIDHQFGKINGLALDRGIHIAYGPKQNGVIEIRSLNFPKRAQFHIHSIPDEKEGDWADHLRGAAKVLARRYRLRVGLSAVIEGTLPIGGLSSSAAVIIAFLSALAKVNGIQLESWETVSIVQEAENQYVGVNCGKLDPSCEVLCRKDHLLYMDCKDDSYTLIPQSPNMKPFKIAVIFSGLERSLTTSQYNLRQDECKAAAYSLLAYGGLDYGKLTDARLRDVPVSVFEAYKDKLPQNFRKRAEHYFSEYRRVEAGVEAWKKGDIEAYGQLIFESGQSSIENYECGCPESISLYEIMRTTDGVYGGRFSGAGFRGSCMALIDPAKAEEIEASIGERYIKLYPSLAEKYRFHLCDSADGVKL